MLENYQTSHISKRIIVFFRSPKDLFRFSKYISISSGVGCALGKLTKFLCVCVCVCVALMYTLIMASLTSPSQDIGLI